MAINFPNSPSLNDDHTVGTSIWRWDGSKWIFVGDLGYTGSKGDTGDQGVIGFTGSQGDQGVIGFTGSQGDTGPTGFTGSKGSDSTVAGPTGFTGSQGAGFTGSAGSTGFTGSSGVTSIVDNGDATAITIGSDETVTFAKAIQENVYTNATVGATFALDPSNGTIQNLTLSASSTFSDSLSAGEYITMHILDGTAYTITWPTMEWIGGTAPTLDTTNETIINVWKVGSVLYGALVGVSS